MDWASEDYSQVYADTYLSPAPSSGIYIDERRRNGRDHDEEHCHRYDRHLDERHHHGCYGEDYRRHCAYDEYQHRRRGDDDDRRRRDSGDHRRRRDGGDGGGGGERHRGVEGFTSNRGDHARAVYDVAREARPRMSRLVPAWPRARSEAFTHPEAAAMARPEGAAMAAETFVQPGLCASSADLHLQYLKVFLLITIVVLLAMTLVATGRLLWGLEKSLKIAIKALAATKIAPH